MKKLALAIACTTLLALSACSSTGSMDEKGGNGNAEVAAMIKEAEAAIKKAASAGGAWRDSQNKFVKQAKAAASKGDFETAMKFAKKAKFEGEMAYQQAFACFFCF